MHAKRLVSRERYLVHIINAITDEPIITEKFVNEKAAVSRALYHCKKQACVYVEYLYRGRSVGYRNPEGLAYLPQNWSNGNDPE